VRNRTMDLDRGGAWSHYRGMLGWLLLVGLALLVAGIVLESRRQQRKYGPSSGRGGDLMGAGMLEMQRLLQPDRKVEILMEHPDSAQAAAREGAGDVESGEGKEKGKAPNRTGGR
jgi:hypothetical protein